ncbi:MAG: hypothetical protein ACI4WT_02505 [Oligosphaeraceae bacterium]
MATEDIYIIEDGDAAPWTPDGCPRLRRVAPAARPLPPGLPVLACGGETRRRLLGQLLRERRPFALASLDGLDGAELSRLEASLSRRRRLHAYLLGGRRVLPGVCALKELVTGGSLGHAVRVALELPGDATAQERLAAADVRDWLDGGQAAQDGGQAVAVAPATADAPRLWRVRAAGAAGEALLALRPDTGEGELRSVTGGHARVRRFGAVVPLALELALLAALGGRTAPVPALVPLALACGNLKKASSSVNSGCKFVQVALD